MRSWPAAELPVLPPGPRPQLRLHDTAARQVHPAAAGPGEARMYVCGITPYDAAHLGHAATYIAFDLVYRFWRDEARSVRYVQNVTDIDDPLLERAARDNIAWDELASREIQRFRDDMTALRVLPPDEYLGVVESIDGIAEMVAKLLAQNAAYRLDNGDVYFDLSAAKEFGYESQYDQPTMLALFAERGGDPSVPGKRQPLDPLLWQAARPGEPSWPAEVGAGRPGWHIECSVIAVSELGMRIDVQGGGSDLIFPHHEMSAAHAEVAYSEHPFARSYVHAGLLALDGAKMSKSQGNLVFAGDLIGAGVEPAAIRLALLAGHYRTDRPWRDQLLRDAERRLTRWHAATVVEDGPDAATLLADVRNHLANDLDTPGALTAIDRYADATLAQAGTSNTGPALMRDAVDTLLGIQL